MNTPVHKVAMRCVSSVLVVFFAVQHEGIAQQTEKGSSPARKCPEVTIPDTELRTLHSKIVDQDFTIYVQLPPSYADDSAAIYPVLYVTDANRSFPMVSNIASVLAFPKGNLPEIIVVGIGYPIRDMADWGAWRTRDLTPTNDTATDTSWNRRLARMTGRKFDVRSGGASRFLDFITDELMPFMESNYRVSHSDRGLAGYSYGGLFALYTLFTRPEIFGRIYAGSPSVEFDNDVIFKQATNFLATERALKTRMFLSVGSLEDSTTIAGVKKMSAMLASRCGPDAQVSLQVFDGEDHRSCMAAAVMRAFRILYGR